ncbi:MFS transporter-like protein 126 [Elsinoe australis]|uniref:MFS transporter-like protein 126 n=1 Tax=Elsinoe australis TaxID=40998 RepID=A0A4U7AJP8_9PEZI|nr:MFS transporter-like protein 126 [Elsinoe australis]
MADEKDPRPAQVERVLSEDAPVKGDHIDYDRVDNEIAKYANADHVVEIDETESKRLKKMIDRRVLSIMIFTYFLQALDKGTMSFASIMGIKEDNKLVGQQYSWLTTCIYIAILIIEYPINVLITRVPIAKTLGISIIIWGGILACHAATHNFTGLVIVRTLLGSFEAICQPAFVVLSGMWYKRSEQADAVTYWYMMNGGQQIVGGLLAYCFTLIPKGRALTAWQVIFMAYGLFSMIWGGFVIYWMPDSPMRAKCFSEEDKALMVERVRSNQTGLQNRKFRPEQIKEALLDPQCWCYGLIQFTTTLPTSGLGAFANLVITDFGFTRLQTQLLAMVLGAVIIIILLSSAWFVKKTGQNLFIMGLYIIPSFVGTVVLMTVQKDGSMAKKVGLLLSYYIVLSFWAAQNLTMSLVSRNVAGQSKRSIAVSMNFIWWATGNAIGPQVFLDWDKPRYFIAFATHMGCYVLLVAVIVFLRWYLKRQNTIRDREQKGSATEGTIHGFDDLTDKQNPSFS